MKKATSKFVLCNALPLFDARGAVRGAVGAFADVTYLKRTEAALRESEERLRFALEAANAGTWEAVPETGEFTASDRALALHGAPPGTPMSLEKAMQVVHPEDLPRIKELVHQVLASGEPFRIEFRVPLPDGSIRWVESCGEPRSVSGKWVVSGLLQDITERKRAEIALRESEELLRSIIEHIPVPLMVSREDRKVLLINPALTRLTGYTTSDIPTRDEWESLAYRDDSPRVKEDFHRTLESGLPGDLGDYWVYPKSGEKRLWSVKRAPAGRDTAGQRLVVGVALDITETKRAETELQRSEARYRTLVQATSAVTWSCPPLSCHVVAQPAWMAFSGQTAEEMPGDGWTNVVHPDDLAVARELWADALARGEPFVTEHRIHRHDGAWRWMSVHVAPIRDAGGSIVEWIGMNIDITERKDAEAALRENKGRLSSIIDTAADSIVVIDEKGIIQSANRATSGIFGYSPDELIGRHASILMPPDRASRVDLYLSSFSGSKVVEEMEAQRKDGSLVPLNVAVAEWRAGDGKRFFTGIFRDLSERKRNEEGLANARRLEAVGQLAGGVAHDFNNLLAVIAGNLELAEDRITDGTTYSLIRRALDAAEKGSGLTRRLLSLARKRPLKPEQLNLNDRVQETAKLLASTVGEHISVTTDLATGLWMTLADPGEIDSAILNLAANARDAMPDGGCIRIATSNFTLDAPSAARLHVDARPGNYVCLAITDDGFGMADDVLGKAMEPFFTTKGPGAGTGLGLASVANFARQTGGFITIESAPERGCTVSIYLPRATMEAAARGLAPGERPPGRGGFILVVEDDDEVREVTLKRLQLLGYLTIEARTGPEAIERLKSEERIQLVLSDVIMPGGMAGYDVARWVALNKPATKVILCSGYSEGDRGGDEENRGVMTLGKPCTRDELARALSNALALDK